jgi:hypothetical protein
MMYLAKCALVAVSCLICVSSGTCAVMPVQATGQSLGADVVAKPMTYVALPAIKAAVASVSRPQDVPKTDALLVLMLGVVLVSLQLRRRQRSLQAPRLMI